MKVGSAIDLNNALVIPVAPGLMIFFGNGSVGAFNYLALHGTYCVLWLIKDRSYPDKGFDGTYLTVIALLFVFLPLAGFYVAPYMPISWRLRLTAQLIALALVLSIFAILLHYIKDAQKYFTQRNRKGLIKDGCSLLPATPILWVRS
jgi:hypothetical protein